MKLHMNVCKKKTRACFILNAATSYIVPAQWSVDKIKKKKHMYMYETKTMYNYV